MEKRMAFGALVISICALAFSAYTYVQLPEDAGMHELSARIETLESDVALLQTGLADIRSTTASQSVSLDFLGQQVDDLGVANDALATIVDLSGQVQQVKIWLGHCLLLEFEGGGFSYSTDIGTAPGPPFGSFEEYVTRCD
jgi:outer membrane murein-binding lipoprotein Lpp